MNNPIISYYDNNNIQIHIEQWYINNILHRLDKPAIIFYYKNGSVQCELWYENNKHHRLDGPANIHYDIKGNIEREYWYINGNQINPPYKKWPILYEQQIKLKLKYG